ncbi:MAG TPA: hypothetical protein VKV20_19805 [Ktedonobacteraceae bacterium]|nr:hypothetical protein [Ktedonobacteraceae bacterium]
MQEAMTVVASTPHQRQAGRILATWVKVMLFNCLCAHPERDHRFDVQLRLLALGFGGHGAGLCRWWHVRHEVVAGSTVETCEMRGLKNMVKVIEQRYPAFYAWLLLRFPER